MGTIIIALIIRIIHTAKQLALITAGIVVAIIFVGIFLLASVLQVKPFGLRSLVSLATFLCSNLVLHHSVRVHFVPTAEE